MCVFKLNQVNHNLLEMFVTGVINVFMFIHIEYEPSGIIAS